MTIILPPQYNHIRTGGEQFGKHNIKLRIISSNRIKNSQFYRKPLKGYSILKLSKISTKGMQIFWLLQNFPNQVYGFLFSQLS